MTVENDFLPFATGAGANVIDQPTYAALAALMTGFQAGTAQSAQLNKVWRQSSIMAAVMAQFIVAQTGQPAIDDGTTAALLANLIAGVDQVARTRLASPPAIGSTAPAPSVASVNVTTSQLAIPGTATGTGSTMGGTLPAATWYVKIVAVDSLGGTTTAGAESIGVATTGATSSIAYTWPAVAGAVSYQIWYGTAAGAETAYYTSTTNSFTLTAATGTAGTIPNTNTTGGVSAAGPAAVAPATKTQHAVQLGQIQTQAGTAFTTAGAAPNFTLTPSPAINAYAAPQRFRVKFNANGTTGSNTLNVSGQGAVSLMQYGPDGVLVPAVIPSGLLSDVEYNGTCMVVLDPVSSGFVGQQSISASVASNALTATLQPTALAFRNATLNNGAPVNLSIGSALSITVPSGATLGTVNGQQATLVFLVAYNAGSPVLCVANLAGGLDLSERNLISPTTISAGATSASVIYSASAVAANNPYRVIGEVDITEATAGTWATAPTLVQGIGGQALAALQSLGYGQTQQNLTGSRAFGTTYYNTTGRPILLEVAIDGNTTSQATLYKNGAVVQLNGYNVTNSQYLNFCTVVMPGQSYQITASSPVTYTWYETR